MTKNIYFPSFDLQLFSEGAGSGNGVSGATGGTVTAAASQNTGANVSDNGTAPAAEVQNDEGNTTDRAAEFEKLIKGEYKDLYDARVQDIVKKRFKSSQENEEKYRAVSPVLEALADKYGVDPSDVDALKAAIDKDDAYYESEAAEKGVTVQQLKELKRVQRENSAMKKQIADQNRRAQYDKWMGEAEQLKTVYPSFDLNSEIKNAQFMSLLRNNIDMRTAFEVVHHDEILPAAMQVAARKVEEKMANKVMNNASRPTENGTGSQSAASSNIDVSKMTKAQREEINRRVARGEKIDLTKL